MSTINPLIFTLFGKMQSGKNRVLITRKGQRYPPKRFKVWRDAMLAQIGRIDRPFIGPVTLIVEYVPQDKIRRDATGILDAICHLLERSGIVTDDAQVKTIQWTEFPIAAKGGCIVTVKPLDNISV